MAKASINVQTTDSAFGAYSHNDRTGTIPNYLIGGSVEVSCGAAEAMRTSEKMINDAHKKQMTSNGRVYWDVTKVRQSAIININEEHTLDDVIKTAEALAKRMDWQLVQVAVHRDEGYKDESKDAKYLNLHAHAEFVALSAQDGTFTAKSRHMRPVQLSQMQDFVAESLNMERGRSWLKGEKAVKRLEHYEYRRNQERLQSANDKVRELDAKAGDLSGEIEKLEALTEQYQQKIDKNEALASKAQGKADEIQVKLDSLTIDAKAEINKLESELERLERNVEIYKSRASKAQNEYTKIEDKLESFKGNTHQLGQAIERFKTKTKTEIVKVKKGAFSAEKREMLDVKHIAPMIDTAFEYGKKYAFTNYNETLLAENAALKAQLDGINERHNAQIAELQARHKKEIAAVTGELRERINTLEGLVSSGASTKADHELEIKHLHAHVERLSGEIAEIMDYGQHYEKEANTGGLSPYFDSKADDLAKIGIGAGATPQLGRRP